MLAGVPCKKQVRAVAIGVLIVFLHGDPSQLFELEVNDLSLYELPNQTCRYVWYRPPASE